MNGLLEQFAVSLRLYFRNKMGMFYGYMFPAIFLLAFRVLYRNEAVPMARHMGQLLTVTVLGGACLGMPTTMVSERERGVWRRYRLTPVSTRSLVASGVVVRYFIVITAGLLQLALAMGIGMPLPKHPMDLCLAFTFVAFAFLGLGLVIATMADNVPSVQALGQCIFLPMLIIGGVAVPLASLPDWALHVSAFFPGRYAVESLQACITGSGAGAARFDFLALFVIGLAGCVAGGFMFRWDAQQRFAARGKGWLIAVIGACAIVGGAAELKHGISGDKSSVTQPARSSAAPGVADQFFSPGTSGCRSRSVKNSRACDNCPRARYSAALHFLAGSDHCGNQLQRGFPPLAAGQRRRFANRASGSGSPRRYARSDQCAECGASRLASRQGCRPRAARTKLTLRRRCARRT